MRTENTAVYFLFTLVVIVSLVPGPGPDPDPVLVTDLVLVLFFPGFLFFLLFKEFFMHARKQQRLNSMGSQKSGSQWKVKKSKPNRERKSEREGRKNSNRNRNNLII